MEGKQKETIAISTLLLLGVLSGAYVMNDKPVYYCEDKPDYGLLECYNLTQYYGLPNGKCWNTEHNRLCRTGWLEVEDDRVPDDEDIPIHESNVDARKIICDQTGCVNYVK